LPFETTEEELEGYFSPFGKVIECHIPVDDQKRNKGFAFVAFAAAVDALGARTQLDKVDFQGRLLHILPARPPPAAPNSTDANLTWKQRQELARKEQETKSGEASKGWSASFIRGDAVVDNLAERLGLRKGDILGVKDKLSSGDAAVRLALGETQIIEENREYFKKHGVDMDALVSASGDDKNAKRSKTAFLVKNLPYDTRVEELTKLFHVGEEPVNILLPPSRTIAMVEYGHSTDAKKAFRKLAYRRFKHVPIYLEWAPLAAKSSTESAEGATTSPPAENTPAEHGKVSPLEDSREDHETEGGSSTIYVKNLNFETTEETLRQVFEKQIGVVRSVKIPQKVAPVQNQEEEARFLSMGYGFVELASHDLVKKAMSKLQGKLVDGHPWELTISSKTNRPSVQEKSAPDGKNPTKLVVRNVPFQATRTELLKLFGTFGQLRKVRLPKKFDGTHRGFAFVEFLTGKEALAAMNALSRTHLYGRHLVLEWATDDDQNIDKLREKAKRDAGASVQPPKNKKIRFD
jgi:multiple RNA-binding domain-containing protein 1